jgi:hypothetical protein
MFMLCHSSAHSEYLWYGITTLATLIRPLSLVTASVVLSGCREPPPPSVPGAVPAFDQRLSAAAQRWHLLVRRRGHRIERVDLHGQTLEVVFDLEAAADLEGDAVGRRGVSGTQLSRDKKRLLFEYVSDDGGTGSHLLLVTLETRSRQHVGIQSPGFESLDRFAWLGNESFVTVMRHYPPGAAPEYQDKLFLFTVHDPRRQREMTPQHAPVRRPQIKRLDDEVLLLADGSHVHGNRTDVYALESKGLREATLGEALAYDDLRTGSLHLAGGDGPCRVEVEKEEDFSDHVLFYVHACDRWVRQSESVSSDPEWSDELQLYHWTEGWGEGDTFLMDAEGHYRKAFTGEWIGAVPAGTPSIGNQRMMSR